MRIGGKRLLLGLLVLCPLATGCATVTRGPTETFTVRSKPPGATASSSSGWECVTPCTLQVNRRGDFIVLVRKEGYSEKTVKVQSIRTGKKGSLRKRVGADVGWIGSAADAVTGANYEHAPNPLVVTLEPDE